MFERCGVDEHFKATHQELLPKTTLPVLDHLSQIACQAVFCNDFEGQAKTHTAAGHLAVCEAHQFFLERMGLKGPARLSVCLDQFKKVKGSDGPAAVVKTCNFSEQSHWQVQMNESKRSRSPLRGVAHWS